MERIRDVSITIEIDTNKQDLVLEFPLDDYESADDMFKAAREAYDDFIGNL